MVHRVAVAPLIGADDGGLCQSLQRIWCHHLKKKDGNHVHADSACTGNVLISRVPATSMIVFNATG